MTRSLTRSTLDGSMTLSHPTHMLAIMTTLSAIKIADGVESAWTMCHLSMFSFPDFDVLHVANHIKGQENGA